MADGIDAANRVAAKPDEGDVARPVDASVVSPPSDGPGSSPGIQTKAPDPTPFDVTWTSPSDGPNGSMPIGNGDIGLNVWVQKNGDLVFYVSKTDAWINNALFKLGRVRVKLDPNPLDGTAAFSQTLRLATGEMQIKIGSPGKEVTILLWVDANHPVVRLEASSAQPFGMQVALETWRADDTVASDTAGKVVFSHRSASSGVYNRVFGGALSGAGLAATGPATLASRQPAARFVVTLNALTKPGATAEAWLTALEAQWPRPRQRTWRPPAAHTASGGPTSGIGAGSVSRPPTPTRSS